MILNNGLGIIDFSHALDLVPRQNKLLSGMNLFGDKKFGYSNIASVTRVVNADGTISFHQRGSDRNFLSKEKAVQKHFTIPFASLDGAVDASDIQNFASYFQPDSPKTSEEVVRRNVTRIMGMWQNRWERSMFNALRGVNEADGSTQDLYAVWGETKKVVSVDFASATVDPGTTIEVEGRGHIVTKAGDSADQYEIVAICHTTFFQKLVDNVFVSEAFKYFPSQQDPLRTRLGGNTINRSFTYKGVIYVEDISGYLEAGKAVLFPKGIEGMFTAHYAPADAKAYANTQARESYLFINDTFRKTSIETESSYLFLNSRPELCVELVAA